MRFIKETSNRNISFLLQPFNPTQLYNKLTTLLPESDMRCLAKPELIADTTSWSASCGTTAMIVAWQNLSEEQKDDLADNLETFKRDILLRLAEVRDVQSVLLHLFTIPDASDMMAVIEDNRVYPLLLEWGCRSSSVSSSADPVTAYIKRPRTNSGQVEVVFAYHTGEPACLIPFELSYLDRTLECHTDSEGKYVLGRCKFQTRFSVSHKAGTFSVNREFTVSSGGIYSITLNRVSELVVQVVDQYGQPVPGTRVCLRSDDEHLFQTDAEGRAQTGSWKTGDTLRIVDTVDETNFLDHTITSEDTIVTLNVVRHKKAACKILVYDEYRNPVSGYELDLEYNRIREKRNTNEFGLVGVAENLFMGNTIRITNPSNPANQLEAVLEHPENMIEFVLLAVPVQQVTFRLVDKRKNPLPHIEFDLMIQGKKQRLKSDDQGVCMLPAEMFRDGELMKAEFHISSRELRRRLKNKK